MIYEAQVRGRTNTNNVILTMPDDDYVIGLKIEGNYTHRSFIIDPCNTIGPNDHTNRRFWIYFIVQETNNPKWVSRYIYERDVIVIGLFNYRRHPDDKKVTVTWTDFLSADLSRQEFSDTLYRYKAEAMRRFEKEKEEDSDERKRVLAGAARRIAG